MGVTSADFNKNNQVELLASHVVAELQALINEGVTGSKLKNEIYKALVNENIDALSDQEKLAVLEKINDTLDLESCDRRTRRDVKSQIKNILDPDQALNAIPALLNDLTDPEIDPELPRKKINNALKSLKNKASFNGPRDWQSLLHTMKSLFIADEDTDLSHLDETRIRIMQDVYRNMATAYFDFAETAMQKFAQYFEHYNQVVLDNITKHVADPNFHESLTEKNETLKTSAEGVKSRVRSNLEDIARGHESADYYPALLVDIDNTLIVNKREGRQRVDALNPEVLKLIRQAKEQGLEIVLASMGNPEDQNARLWALLEQDDSPEAKALLEDLGNPETGSPIIQAKQDYQQLRIEKQGEAFVVVQTGVRPVMAVVDDTTPEEQNLVCLQYAAVSTEGDIENDINLSTDHYGEADLDAVRSAMRPSNDETGAKIQGWKKTS